MGFKLTPWAGLSLRNGVLYIFMISWCLRAFKRRQLIRHNSINKYILLLIVIAGLSIPVKLLLNEIPDISLYNELVILKSWSNAFILFFILYNTIDDEKTCYRFLTAMMLFLMVTVFSALVVYSGLAHMGNLNVRYERSAGFTEPNQYAALLALFLPLFYDKLIFIKPVKWKVLTITIIVIIFLCFLITGSRGGMLAMVFATVVYAILLYRNRLFRIGRLTAIFLLILPLLFTVTLSVAPGEIKQMLIQRFYPDNAEDMKNLATGSNRTTFWKNGFKLFMQRPIIGHGQETFTALMMMNYSIKKNSHNDYLLYLVHFGIIGLMVFVAALATIYKQMIRLAKSTNELLIKRVSLCYLAGFCGYAFAMFTVNISQPKYLFWAYTAVMLRLSTIDRSNTNQHGHITLNLSR